MLSDFTISRLADRNRSLLNEDERLSTTAASHASLCLVLMTIDRE